MDAQVSEPKKYANIKYANKIWSTDKKVTFSEYMDVIDEGVREMMLPYILMFKWKYRICATKVLLRKAWLRIYKRRWRRISDMILMYIEFPEKPDISMSIYDSDVMQFSKNGESYQNTWRRLVKTHIDLITPSIIKEVMRNVPIKDHPDVKNLHDIIHRYYLNRPTVDDGPSAIRQYDLRYQISYMDILAAL